LLTLDSTAADFSNVVDLYNSTTGAWSTAQLSVARADIVSASVGSVALFAGGNSASASGGCLWFGNCVKCSRVVQHCVFVHPMRNVYLMLTTAGGLSLAVDLYNSTTGAWSTAQLSVPRHYLAAASVGSVALFAGGLTASELMRWDKGLVFWLRVC
jgi:hypothetical protein